MIEENSPEVERILKMFEDGEIGAGTCSRLLAVRCAVEAMGFSEEQAIELERELEFELEK